MEAASWFSVSSVVFLLIGAAVGAAAGHFLSPAIGESRKLRAEVERLRHEHDSYRSSVNSHFRKTADLVGQMTKSYAAVYDHLAGGARRFCDDSGSDAAIPFEPLPGALASPVIETAAGDEAADLAAEVADADGAASEDAATETLADDGLAGYPADDGAAEYPADDGAAELAAAELAAQETAAAEETGEGRETFPRS
jgi:uncharacterized membrane-anchored protein YhcB (DUF1043 family)